MRLVGACLAAAAALASGEGCTTLRYELSAGAGLLDVGTYDVGTACSPNGQTAMTADGQLRTCPAGVWVDPTTAAGVTPGVTLPSHASAPATCDADAEGNMYLDTTTGGVKVCRPNDGGWTSFLLATVGATAPFTCTDDTIGQQYFDTAEGKVLVCAGTDAGWGPVTGVIRERCLEYYTSGDHTGDGIYKVTPPNLGEEIEVYCDMTNGGWTLVGRYDTAIGASRYEPKNHWAQDNSNPDMASPPDLLSGARGHIKYTAWENTGDFSISCGSATGYDAAVTVRKVFPVPTTWDTTDTVLTSSGGAYATDTWIAYGRGGHYRGSHYMCGSTAYYDGDNRYGGIGMCTEAGSGGNWNNHRASVSFWQSTTTIGCNNAQLGSGQARVWIK